MKQLQLFLTFCLLCLPALADSPSAMITSLEGSAVVIQGQQKTSAEPMMTLTPRTLIELGEGSEISLVFFSRGSHERFQGPVLLGIGKNRCKILKGAPSALQHASAGSALIKAIDPHALSEGAPAGGVTVSVDGAKSSIAWTSESPGPYLVSIYRPGQNGGPRTNVWAEMLAANSVVYTGPALDPDITYLVEVRAGNVRVAASQFRVGGATALMLKAAEAEADQMNEADPSDTTPHVLLHTLYAQVGDHDNAALSLYPAADGQPHEDAFVTRLNAMGKQVNRKANADTAYAQGLYRVQDNWVFAPYWDPYRWSWDGWDDL